MKKDKLFPGLIKLTEKAERSMAVQYLLYYAITLAVAAFIIYYFDITCN